MFHIFFFVCFVIYSVNRFKSNFLIGEVVSQGDGQKLRRYQSSSSAMHRSPHWGARKCIRSGLKDMAQEYVLKDSIYERRRRLNQYSFTQWNPRESKKPTQTFHFCRKANKTHQFCWTKRVKFDRNRAKKSCINYTSVAHLVGFCSYYIGAKVPLADPAFDCTLHKWYTELVPLYRHFAC